MHPHAATCPAAPNPASLTRWVPALPCVLQLWTSPPCGGGLRHCHVSRGFRWAVCLKYKERVSQPSYAARLTCSQGTLVYFQGTCT
jgi:hypothetical protein